MLLYFQYTRKDNPQGDGLYPIAKPKALLRHIAQRLWELPCPAGFAGRLTPIFWERSRLAVAVLGMTWMGRAGFSLPALWPGLVLGGIGFQALKNKVVY